MKKFKNLTLGASPANDPIANEIDRVFAGIGVEFVKVNRGAEVTILLKDGTLLTCKELVFYEPRDEVYKKEVEEWEKVKNKL